MNNITLPREVVQEALDALQYAEQNHGGDDCYTDSIGLLLDAIEAQVPEPVRGMQHLKSLLIEAKAEIHASKNYELLGRIDAALQEYNT